MKAKRKQGFVLLMMLVHILVLSSCANGAKGELHVYQEDGVYETDVKQADCYLCGSNPDSPFAPYWGQANFGIVNLNTLELTVCEINRYDEDGAIIPMLERYPRLSGHIWNDDLKTSVDYSYNTNKGFAELSVRLKETSQLDTDNLTPVFCTDCLSCLMNAFAYKDEYCEIALVDFQGHEIRPINRQTVRYFLSEYWIRCTYNDRYDSIDIGAFYCPNRYSELSYDPNETLTEQLSSLCAEYDIPLVFDAEITNFLNCIESIDRITYSDRAIMFHSGLDSLCVRRDGTYTIRVLD